MPPAVHMMNPNKAKAIRLRIAGNSYNEIRKKIDVAKSTLSSWLKDLPISSTIRKNNILAAKTVWARNITLYNKSRALQARLRAHHIESEAARDISPFSKRELKLVGIALYWAEGYKKAKWSALFCNSDPRMVLLMMRFFREICRVPDEKFRPQVQIHPNVSREEAEKYWSKIIRLPMHTFRKPLMQVSKSSKYRRPPHTLPYGTFRIGIADVQVLYKIRGWIKGISENTGS